MRRGGWGFLLFEGAVGAAASGSRGVLGMSTTTVMRSGLTMALVCRELWLLGARTDICSARDIRVRGVWGIVQGMALALGRVARDGVLEGWG